MPVADDGGGIARALLACLHDVVAVVGPDGTLRYANAAAARMLGYGELELHGLNAFDLVHPDDQVGALEGFESTMGAQDSGTTPLLVRLRRADGTYLQTEVIGTNHLTDPMVAGMVLTIRDVSESLRTDEALRESEERYRLIVELAREGVWLIGADGVTTFANRAMAEMLGTTVNAMVGRHLFEFMGEEGRRDAAEKLARRQAGISEEHDFRLVRADGSDVWTRMNTSPILHHDGTYRGAIALVTDVTERRALEHRLDREARRDPLTGVANRKELFEVLETVLGGGGLTAALFVDVDHFKKVNDTHGHSVGDDVLRHVASRLRASMRAGDTVARVGGDEFVVVCDEIETATEAITVAHRIRDALAPPFAVQSAIVAIDASIGIAFARGGTADELLRRADEAMYRAKHAGRGRVEVASDADAA